MKEAPDYNGDLQMHYIANLISDPDKLARCRTIVKETYFDDELQPLIRFILLYADEQRSAPSAGLIQAKTGHIVTLIDEAEGRRNRDWFLSEFEGFCRYRDLENVILDGIDLQRKGQSGEIERRMKEAMTIRLMSDLGTAYFEDPAARLRRMLDHSAIVSTGIKALDDKLYGGFTRGELNLILANSGVGKSLMLLNLALNWVLAGHDVVYLSLELSEDMIALRVDAMLTERGTKEVFRAIDDAALIIGMRGKRAGRLTIKKLPEAGTTTNHLRAYITEYEIIHGHRPDGILVDYLDLMYPNDGKINVSDLHIKDKYVSEELRAFMHEMNAYGASAGQLNRGSIAVQGEFDQSHVAGGISKINTSDNVMSLFAPSHLKERGEMIMTFLKTRNSAAVGYKITLGYNANTMRIGDYSNKPGADHPKTREELVAEMAHQAQNETIMAQSGNQPQPTPAEATTDAPSTGWSQKVFDLMNRSRTSNATLE